jgi:hypothetical protein
MQVQHLLAKLLILSTGLNEYLSAGIVLRYLTVYAFALSHSFTICTWMSAAVNDCAFIPAGCLK